MSDIKVGPEREEAIRVADELCHINLFSKRASDLQMDFAERYDRLRSR